MKLTKVKIIWQKHFEKMQDFEDRANKELLSVVGEIKQFHLRKVDDTLCFIIVYEK